MFFALRRVFIQFLSSEILLTLTNSQQLLAKKLIVSISISPLQSRVGKQYSDYYFPSTMSNPGSPIPADDDTVDIDAEDVEYYQTGAQPLQSTTSSLGKRPLELTDIEGTLKRGVTSALQQSPLFVLDKEIITAADATAFQLQANRWNDNFAHSDVIVGRSIVLLDMSIRSDPSFTMLSEADIPRWIELLSVAQAAELVVRHFGARPDSGRTLAENFGNLRFSFNFADLARERGTMIAMVQPRATARTAQRSRHP
jgi:hypothetical protein